MRVFSTCYVLFKMNKNCLNLFTCFIVGPKNTTPAQSSYFNYRYMYCLCLMNYQARCSTSGKRWHFKFESFERVFSYPKMSMLNKAST